MDFKTSKENTSYVTNKPEVNHVYGVIGGNKKGVIEFY